MDPTLWQRIEDLFNETLALPSNKRKAFLADACGADAELRAEVESLLREAEDQPDDFLSEPAVSLGAQLLCRDQSEALRGRTLGAYTITRLIGRGGMGEVYLAHDVRLERRVAIKLLPISLTQYEERVRRFKHEARAASAISHPNVASVYEIGEADGRLFTAMEFVDGLTLRERFSWGTLKLGEAIDIATQVASAIAAAHAEGIVHRDIKPENILIRRDGLIKVVDFGLAKLTEPQLDSPHHDFHETQMSGRITRMIHTEPDVQMGTPNYMSPEQARCQEVDARTDIWSWGVVFYEMLMGQLPFTGATKSDVIAEILKSTPPLWQENLPESVTAILQRALSKDIRDRHASMKELLGELQNLSRQLGDSGLLDLPLDEVVAAPSVTGREAPPQVAQRAEGLRETAGRPNRPDHATGRTARAEDTGGTSIQPLSAWPLTLIRIKPGFRLALFICAGGLLLVALVFIIYNFTNRQAARLGNTSGSPQITNLTHDGHVMDAAISGDARLLAYVLIESGKQSLWIQNLESGEKRQLLPPDPALCWGLRFTPNGQNLFYITTQPGSTISVLYRIPVRSGPSYKLVVNIDSPPAVSPDGMQIAFIRGYPAQHRDALVIANVDGSAEREIASRQHPDKFSFSGPSWSPNGKLIALGAGRSNGAQFAVVGIPVNGGTPVELTSWQLAAVGGVAWDNDGHTLIFSARALGTRVLQMWRLSYPDGEMRRLTQDENAYEGITLAQSGNTLITTRTYEVSDIWVVSSSGAARRLTTEGNNGADGLTVTPTGRILYTVGEYEQSILWSMNMDGSDQKPLTENIGFLPSASKDGRFIAYVSMERGNRHIWLMDTTGNNNRQLTDHGGENQPSITPDGNWVVYTSLANERNSLWKISTDGGQPIQLTRGVLTIRPVVSPDGTMIACTYRLDETDKWKIAVLPFDGGRPLRTFPLPQPYNQIIRWSSDSKALVYLDKRNGVHNLWRQPLDASAPSQITNFNEDQILHYDWLPAGAEFVLSRGGRRRDIALVNNLK
jgi:serine/threonine protein kinase/Tol biopolymer transport system component